MSNNSKLREINNSFKNGIVPPEFNFTINENNNNSVDWSQIRFNTFERNNNYTNQEINIINKLTNNIKENALSPSEEMDRLKNESLNMELIQNIKISDNNIENE